MKIAYQEKINTSQLNEVLRVSKVLGIEPDWLMCTMYGESKLNPQAKNPNSSATGLIQFVSDTAFSLGTSVSQLYEMNFEHQIQYVEKYLMPYKGKMKSYRDVYLAVFNPSFIGKKEWVLPQSKYLPNKGMDFNKDGRIDQNDFDNWINRWIPLSKKKLMEKLVTLCCWPFF